MCRYSMSGPYKRHFVCFSCRKAFKQPPIEDYLQSRGHGFVYKQLAHLSGNPKILKHFEEQHGHRLSDLQQEYRDATHNCPDCAAPMIDMGLDFKTPRQSDEKAWKLLQGMYRVGHAFHTCGCSGPGWIPRSTNDYLNYLATTKKEYEEQLGFVQRGNKLNEESCELSPEGRKEALEYWTSRIDAIAREQKAVV